MAKYVYPAIFTQDLDGFYYVNFPDISSCFADGNTLIEAIENAQEVLALMLHGEENIPIATPINSITTKDNDFATLIYCDTDNYNITECDFNEE